MLITSPLHSVTSPTVGLGYLAAETRAHGFACTIRDFNIGLLHHLRGEGVPENWLQWIFPYGERTYGGELLLSQACFDIAPDEILRRARRVTNDSFQDFLARLSPERWLLTAEAKRVCTLVRAYLNSCADYIVATAQEWVGFSVVATNQVAVIFFLEILARRRSDLRIVLGGPHFHRSNAVSWIKHFPSVDAVIVGDGRGPFLAWLTGNEQRYAGQIVRAASSEKSIQMRTRMGGLPWRAADWTDVIWQDYRSIFSDADLGETQKMKGAAVPVLGARGCSYNRCTFCYEVLLAPRFEPREVTDVVDEVCKQRNTTGQTDFFFTDLDLNSDYNRTLELADQIRSRAPGIRFHCWLRAHELDEPILAALYSAGARTWFVGIEAVVDGPLERMRKGYSASHARRVVQTMAEFAEAHPDVYYGFNLIPNYPGETVDEVMETFQAIEENAQAYIGRVSCLFDFTLTSNTIAWLQRENLGLQNIVGWNEIILPGDWAQLPSHRYWYDSLSPDLKKRRLLWDHVRVLVGHEPRYLARPQVARSSSAHLPIAE